VSHDTDKLIRQLSLVAFLMAERRPLTARDVKSNVEGYSEMSDEAFARRFYSDRSELIALGVPLHSQRDEFTGEELYTLRSEHYFLDALDLDDGELAALTTALFMLEGQFAYAEPLRLALQNLALGRPGFPAPQGAAEARVTMRDLDYSPEMAGRLAKLETAISKGRTVKFAYWSIARDQERERTVNPLALLHDMSAWYVVGEDLEDEGRRKKFRVSRIRSDIRFATRRERDFRFPGDFEIDDYRGKPPWQVGEVSGTARVEVHGDTAWWVARTLPNAGTLQDGIFETPYASVGPLASWVLRQNGRAVPVEPAELRETVAEALALLRERHEGEPPRPARNRPRSVHPAVPPERLPGPVAPERFGVLQALLAHLLAACGEDKEAELDAAALAQTFSITVEELEEALSLLNLVNFGGGCYTVYAELTDGVVRVDKELYGDVFRRPPKLTPLEARAIRLALEFVGPMIAADSRSPLEKVRGKLEETFGQFELSQTPEVPVQTDEERLVAALSDAMAKHRVVRIEYLKEEDAEPTAREIEPYQFVRELPHWYVHTWDRHADGPRTFRLDRMRSAKPTGERFEPRPDFDPSYLRDPRVARLLYAKPIARWKVERGARPLADGSAVADVPYATEEWLLTEVLADRGEAVVLEPAALRTTIAKRARELVRELKARPRARA
jgi:predicted DNA-binding transcriptional regulator YafY